MENRELIQRLRQLRELFDEGCDISVGDEGFYIEGRDSHPDDTSETGDIVTVRRYFVGFVTDDADNYYDTLSDVIDKIKADAARLDEIHYIREYSRNHAYDEQARRLRNSSAKGDGAEEAF